MKPVHLRALLAIVIVVAAAGTTRPAGADTALGGALGTSSRSEAGHTVTGTGTWELWGEHTLTIAFECASISGPDAVSTSIEPPAYGGCVLVRNGVTIATAPGRGLPGPLAVTQGTTTFSLYNTLSLLVCWNAYASFQDGYHVHTSGCSNISIVNSVPHYQPGDDITDESLIGGSGFLFAVGTGGQNESDRVLCATTSGSTADCVVGVTGTGSAGSNDVSISGTGPANGGCNWVCANPGEKSTASISGTGPAGGNCANVVAVSATGDACGNTAVSGTGNANGGFAVSGLGYATGSNEEFSGREEVCTQANAMC